MHAIVYSFFSANDMRKKALLLKFPTKDKLKRTGRQAELDYLTEV